MANSPKLKKAIDEVFKELMEMPTEKFKKKLAEHSKNIDPVFSKMVNDNFWEFVNGR